MSKLLPLSVHWFLHLKNGMNNSFYPIGWLQEETSLIHTKGLVHCVAHGRVLINPPAPWLPALMILARGMNTEYPGTAQRETCNSMGERLRGKGRKKWVWKGRARGE